MASLKTPTSLPFLVTKINSVLPSVLLHTIYVVINNVILHNLFMHSRIIQLFFFLFSSFSLLSPFSSSSFFGFSTLLSLSLFVVGSVVASLDSHFQSGRQVNVREELEGGQIEVAYVPGSLV